MTTTRKERKPTKPSRSVLRLIPERVVVFLSAVATTPEIRAALAAGGYTKEDHVEGSALLLGLCAYRKDDIDPVDAGRARAARLELMDWSRNLGRFRFAIERLHPDHTPMFEDTPSAPRKDAVRAVRTFIERVRALPEESKHVHDMLARRGLDEAEQARLLQLVDVAQTERPSKAASARDSEQAELVKLYRWHSDWATTARAFIKRHDLLVALGLAGRPRTRPETFFEDPAATSEPEPRARE